MNKITFTRALSGFCRLHGIDIALLHPLYGMKDFEASHTLEFLCSAANIRTIFTELKREADIDLEAKRDEEGVWKCTIQQKSGRGFRVVLREKLEFIGVPYLSIGEIFQRTTTQNDIRYLDPVDQVLVLLIECGAKPGNITKLKRFGPFIRQTAKDNPDVLLDNLTRLTTAEKALQIEEEINRNGIPESITHGMKPRFAYMAWKWQGISSSFEIAAYYTRKLAYRLFMRLKRLGNKL